MQTPEDRLLAILDQEGPQLQGLLFRLTLSDDAVEELMQELFLTLYRSQGYAEASNPVAYAYRTAIHLASNWRRTRKRNPPPGSLAAEPAIADPAPLDRLAQSEELSEILDAVHHLQEPYRLIFVMHHLQEASYEAIAPLVSRTPHQVRALCHRALIKLRSRLRSESEPEMEEESHVDDG